MNATTSLLTIVFPQINYFNMKLVTTNTKMKNNPISASNL